MPYSSILFLHATQLYAEVMYSHTNRCFFGTIGPAVIPAVAPTSTTPCTSRTCERPA